MHPQGLIVATCMTIQVSVLGKCEVWVHKLKMKQWPMLEISVLLHVVFTINGTVLPTVWVLTGYKTGGGCNSPTLIITQE